MSKERSKEFINTSMRVATPLTELLENFPIDPIKNGPSL